MSRTMSRLALLLPLSLLALSGCSATDPFTREGTWKPSGVNEANIAAQAANPADLARGRADSSGTYRAGTSAVDRLWQGAPTRPQTPAQALGLGGARPGETPR